MQTSDRKRSEGLWGIWLCAAAAALALCMTLALSGLIGWRGLAHFWPQPLWQMQYQIPGQTPARLILGERIQQESVPRQRLLEAGLPLAQEGPAQVSRSLFKIGLREAGEDFVWLVDDWLTDARIPHDLLRVERREWGDLYGRLLRIERNGQVLAGGTPALAVLPQYLHAAVPPDDVHLVLATARSEQRIALSQIVRVTQPNALDGWGKVRLYVRQLWAFLSQPPRNANTEGGVFPAIFGTALMTFLMTLMVTPLGTLAALYLHEYAKSGLLTRLIRIAVHNLAGVPSIVYGVFGLGFLVYFLGGNIDRLLFAGQLPAPTFGTPGLLWASLTLALLTLPVVIVSTEEGLARVPRTLREASLALGATQAETLWRVVLPMASPALMTGVILALARAAGEVAPLMLVGAVKLAPTLPLDGTYPYLHLEQKFMHLGFHIYDLAFQSPNIEAARPLVYATAALLVGLIVLLNLSAVLLRSRLRERYRMLDT